MKHLLTTILLALSIAAQANVTDSTSTQSITDQFLHELLQFTKDAGAFAKEEIPLVLKEYVMWGIVRNGMIALLLFIGGYAMLQKSKWSYAKAKEMDARENADDSSGMWAMWAFLGIGSIASFVTAAMSLVQMTKAAIAPRVYLIDQLSNLIR